MQSWGGVGQHKLLFGYFHLRFADPLTLLLPALSFSHLLPFNSAHPGQLCGSLRFGLSRSLCLLSPSMSPLISRNLLFFFFFFPLTSPSLL